MGVDFDQILLVIGILATLLFIIKTLITAFTAQPLNPAQKYFETFKPVTVESISAFFMGFSWISLMVIVQMGFPRIVAVLLGIISGFVFLYIAAFLVYLVKKS